VLILRLGETLVPSRGPFDQLVIEAAGLAPEATQVVSMVSAAPWSLPEPQAVRSGVVLTGSAAMVGQRLPFSVATAKWLEAILEAPVPVLGICYGHQLIAEVLGGQVGPNPRGREIGTIEVTLTPEGRRCPLFVDAPETLLFQATHSESVLELPQGATLLASNSKDPHQAYCWNDRVFGVQFHPEFDREIIRGYLEARTEMLADEGLDAPHLREEAEDSSQGPALLKRFASLCTAFEASTR